MRLNDSFRITLLAICVLCFSFVAIFAIRSDRARLAAIEACLAGPLPPPPESGSDPCFQIRQLRSQMADEIHAMNSAARLTEAVDSAVKELGILQERIESRNPHRKTWVTRKIREWWGEVERKTPEWIGGGE